MIKAEITKPLDFDNCRFKVVKGDLYYVSKKQVPQSFLGRLFSAIFKPSGRLSEVAKAVVALANKEIVGFNVNSLNTSQEANDAFNKLELVRTNILVTKYKVGKHNHKVCVFLKINPKNLDKLNLQIENLKNQIVVRNRFLLDQEGKQALSEKRRAQNARLDQLIQKANDNTDTLHVDNVNYMEKSFEGVRKLNDDFSHLTDAANLQKNK